MLLVKQFVLLLQHLMVDRDKIKWHIIDVLVPGIVLIIVLTRLEDLIGFSIHKMMNSIII